MESSGSGSSLSLKVAGQILRSDLGELVETVGVHLLEHGPCTLIQLASGLESTGSTLTATQIRASLLVLFQHNIASVAAPAAPPPAAPAQRGRAAAARPAAGNGGAAGSVSAAGKRPVYHASLDEVLARRWYPWVVCATRRRIGDDAAALLVEVLALGRCTLDSLSRRLAPEGGARREALKAEVTRLLEARYLAAADQLEEDCGEPPLPLPASAGAARGKRKREGGPAGGRGAGAGETGLLAREAKRLWRVNMPEMRQIFRADAMCKLMHEKFDATAAQLLDAVLAMQPPDLTHGAWPLPHSQEERGKPCTTPFTVEELVQECGPLLEGHEFESDRRQLVANYLDTMCNDPLCMMASPLNGKYMLNLAQMTAAIRQLALETAVLNRCGEAACRLFRLLLRFRANGGCPKIEDGVPRVYRLELKQLAELGLMPEKEARPLLWTLMSAGFASLQEVPRSVDHNPRTTCYLWYVDLPRAYRALEAQLLQTHARLATMLEAEQSKAGEQPTSSPPPPTRRSAMIEAALLRTSETLMLVRYV